MVKIFRQISIIYAQTVRPRMTEYGTITRMGKKHISGVSHVHIPRGRRPSVPKIFWDPLPQTYQLSRIRCETHAFGLRLKISRMLLVISRIRCNNAKMHFLRVFSRQITKKVSVNLNFQ